MNIAICGMHSMTPEIDAAKMLRTRDIPLQTFSTYFTAMKFVFFMMLPFAFFVRWIRDYLA